MMKRFMTGLAMSVLGLATAAGAEDVAALAAARGIAGGQVDLAEVRGAGGCPVVLSVDRSVAGADATRGAARLNDGWVLAGQDRALLRVLDSCARPDSNPSQLAAIVAAMGQETPMTPVLENANALVRDRLAAVNRGSLPPETTQKGDTLRLSFQALVGEHTAPAAVTLDWTPGRAATVEVTPY